MKKAISILIILATFLSLSLATTAFAYTPYDVHTPKASTDELAREGMKIPSRTHDLSSSDYDGTFDYSGNLFGNRLFSTSTGSIYVEVFSTIDPKSDNSLSRSNYQTLRLYEKTGTFTYELVASAYNIDRDGYSTARFKNLTRNDAIYFLAFEKELDEVSLEGDFTVSETPFA